MTAREIVQTLQTIQADHASRYGDTVQSALARLKTCATDIASVQVSTGDRDRLHTVARRLAFSAYQLALHEHLRYVAPTVTGSAFSAAYDDAVSAGAVAENTVMGAYFAALGASGAP